MTSHPLVVRIYSAELVRVLCFVQSAKQLRELGLGLVRNSRVHARFNCVLVRRFADHDKPNHPHERVGHAVIAIDTRLTQCHDKI
jgi:hypothetical protein